MTRQLKLGLSLPVAFLLAIAVVALFSRSSVSAAASPKAAASPPPAMATLVSDPILEVDSTTLTTYLPATATAGQGIEPDVECRGVDLDGRLRKPSALGMHLAGNPLGPFAPGTHEVGGVSLMTGGVTQHDVDLAFPADGPRWVIGRSYNSYQNGGLTDSNGPQGKNWFQTAQPEIVLDSNRIYLYYGADRFIEFKLVSDSSDTYRATNGAAGAIVYATNEELDNPIDTYTYVDQASWEWTFFGFEKGDVAAGQIWKIEAPSGEVAYVGDADLANDPITLGYNASGYITEAFDSEDRRYTFTYGTHDSVVRLDSVEVETKGGGTWGSPTGLETLGLVEYEYYSSESYGDPGDLKVVTITTRLNDDGNELVREKYYRYWEGTFNASTNPGYPHCLQYVYDFEGIRRYDWTDSTFDQDYLSETSANLSSYAAAYFEYDSSRRCSELTANGGCGSCGGGSSHGTSLFTYEANGSFSGTSGYDTTWARRALVERADGSFLTQYFDEVGQPLSSLLTDATPASGTPSKWVTEVQRNSDGVTTQVATPAAITAYTHSTGSVTSSNSTGLIRYWTLETAGATKGFVTAQKYNRDKNSSQYFEWSRTLETGSLTVGDTTVYRPVIDDERDYPTAITSGTTGSNLTTRSFTWHSGTLAPKEIAVTWPTVTTSNNGPGSATSSRLWLDAMGRPVWSQAEDGVIGYMRYSAGLTTMVIRDADTSLTGSGEVFNGTTMPGWTLGAGPVHRVVTADYDAGFQPTVTRADGRTQVRYASVLLDRRPIMLSYPRMESGSVFGPVEFRVQNHVGRSTARGRVALAGNAADDDFIDHIDEGESDPLLALDLGTVCRYQTAQYDNTGVELATMRTYFDVPSAEPGTIGTHYDEVAYAYDDMGRRNRTELPHAGLTPDKGTVTKTAFDVLGRVTSRSVGTDDSGTGSDNMVVTELLVYDGNADDGNSHLTKRTERTTASSSGERVTDYEYDIRGNLLLTDAPTPPHTLTKYDNTGRVVARGQYKTSAPAATADPESTTTNRMSLDTRAYDERGRLCQSYVYNIDPSNGTNTSSESIRTDYWYDPTGRSIMVEGAELTKYAYDRLGRQTHHFILAKDDAVRTYTAADDVAGDIVLAEYQTTYDLAGSDNILMEAAIERFHDDHTGSPTTGALDTNADGDGLLYTAGNVKGRIQIAARWYDATDRLIEVVAYGTYGGATFDRDSLAVPTRSDTAHRTSFGYADSGERSSSTDPMGVEDRFEFDDAGRLVAMTRNYEDGTPETAEPDKDQIVRYAYTNGLLVTSTLDLPGGTDQVTTFYHGPPQGTGAGDSVIATTDLLYQVAYPDTTGASDRLTYAYNAQREEVYREDQGGTVLEKTYDESGRLLTDGVTTLGSGVDGAVRLKAFTYEGLGRMATATQYTAVTSGTILDQFEYTYGEWGQVSGFASDVDSEVGLSGIDEHVVSLDYDRSWAAKTPSTNSGARTLVPVSATLPGGYQYLFSQSGAGYHEEAARTSAVKHSSTTVVSFEFVGDQRVSSVTLHVPDFAMDYSGSTSGDYPDWDDFNRVKKDEWAKDPSGGNISFIDREYKRDRNGEVIGIWDYIELNGSGLRARDTLVSRDALGRINGMQRGTLDSTASSISNETMDQDCVLDLAGNTASRILDWNADEDGLDTNEYDESLTHNLVNEATAIGGASLGWSSAGAMVDNGVGRKYVYDAWGRMVEMQDDNSDPIAYYRRNALDHLIGERLDREPNGSFDANDWWEYMVARPSDGALLASFKGGETKAIVQRLWLGGFDSNPLGTEQVSAILEVRDDDQDGNYDRDTVLFVDTLGSIIANYADDGAMGRQLERLQYDMFGVPGLIPWGDVDADGDADGTDKGTINLWWAFSIYNVRGDLDLDGDVDSADYAAHVSSSPSIGKLSDDTNALGYGGLMHRFGTAQRGATQFASLTGGNQARTFYAGPGVINVLDPCGVPNGGKGGGCPGPPADSPPKKEDCPLSESEQKQYDKIPKDERVSACCFKCLFAACDSCTTTRVNCVNEIEDPKVWHYIVFGGVVLVDAIAIAASLETAGLSALAGHALVQSSAVAGLIAVLDTSGQFQACLDKGKKAYEDDTDNCFTGDRDSGASCSDEDREKRKKNPFRYACKDPNCSSKSGSLGIGGNGEPNK